MCKWKASFFLDRRRFKRDMAGETRGHKTRRALEPAKQSTSLRVHTGREQRMRKALQTIREPSMSTSTDTLDDNKVENPKTEVLATSTQSQRVSESERGTSYSTEIPTTLSAEQAQYGGLFARLSSSHGELVSESLSPHWEESAQFEGTLTPEYSSEAAVEQRPESHTVEHSAGIMPDVFEQDEDGDTALHIAIAQTNQPLTGFLIQAMRSKTVDIYNNLRQTPLHLAVLTHQSMMVRKLIEAGADVNFMDRNGQTPLHLACKARDTQSVRDICDTSAVGSSRPRFDLRNFQGFAALHSATFTGNPEIIGLILDSGADINIKDSSSGRTALHHAVELGRSIVAEYLLSRGADVNASTYSRNTCLHTASGRDMDEMVKVLLRHGANVNLANMEGDIPKVVRSSVQAKRQLQKKAEKSTRKRKR